jgi:mannose-6-phosphate isomerase-like protein (cupin superfamily)
LTSNYALGGANSSGTPLFAVHLGSEWIARFRVREVTAAMIQLGKTGAGAECTMNIYKQGANMDSSNVNSINLTQKLKLFSEFWSPKTLTEFNGHDIMVAKILGEYNWHHHDDTDDFFYVLHGEIQIEIKAGAEVKTVNLAEGELFVVPKGVEHRPIARQEAHVLLIERSGTPNSGDPATAAKRTFL